LPPSTTTVQRHRPARSFQVTERTLQRYRAEGLITPEIESKGGHARWDVEKVKEQLRALRRKDDWPPRELRSITPLAWTGGDRDPAPGLGQVR
jgi:transposase